jgi:glucose-1-phosphate thymidylyltransferase
MGMISSNLGARFILTIILQGFSPVLEESVKLAVIKKQATVFGYRVNSPENFGVVEFGNDGKVLSLEEKPENPKSNYAVVGLYFYPNEVVEIAEKVETSERGELEITSINQFFLETERLNVKLLGRGFVWLDTGTHESLAQASTFIEVVETRQGLRIACLEEIAYKKGWISSEKIKEIAQIMSKNEYGKYLLSLIKNQ